MRIWLEVFGIPEEACEPVRQSVYDSYRRFLHRNGSGSLATSLDLRGGTCPLTGRGYLSVRVHSPYPLDLEALQKFADAVYASHPLRDETVVRANRSVRIEDSSPDDAAALEAADDRRLNPEEVSCWICGRFDGEEYLDPELGTGKILEVRGDVAGRVPLCAICLKLLGERRPAC